MKVKLDENVPRAVQTLLADSGHDVDTVSGEGMTGAVDPDVLRAATRARRLLITLDRGMADARRHLPGSHAGILVLRLPDQSAPAVLQAVTTLLARHHLDRLAGTVSVAQRGLLRIRRP